MSIQFRTRSQTVVDYSQYITNNNITGCCYVYNSENNEVSKQENTTISSCNLLSGYFIAGECDSNMDITPSSLGCCCACSFASSGSGTFLKRTTLCECESVSGRWTLGSDCVLLGTSQEQGAETERLCVSGTLENSNQLDYRKKRACCYPEYNDDGTVYANCIDVCTEKECADKTVYPYTSTFYNNGRKCFEQVGNAGPVADECKLSETNTNVLNSCQNGTNVFCWSKSFVSTCSNKTWFDNKFAGRFAQSVNQGVFQIKIKNNPQAYDLILSPKYDGDNETTDYDTYAQTTSSTGVVKVCPGGYVEGRQNPTDGYFAIIDGQNKPVYYATEYFKNLYTQANSNSPIPPSFPPLPRVLDLIATRHFSAFIDYTDNSIKIYGRFYNSKDNQFKTLNTNTIPRLKKIYQHNVYEYNTEGNNSYATSLGFVGQKVDNSFDYYSPFINDIEELKIFRDTIRSLPHKEFVKASLGNFTFCGIDANGIMTCNSLNSELTYPLNRKYRLISCSGIGNGDLDYDYCFAVDENNRIIKIGDGQFENQPIVSYTDVLDISCYAESCFAVVEPDMDICNNQINGSCCQCVDTSPCIQTNQGNCTRLNGKFKSGGICCNLDNPTDGCVDCNTVVNETCGTSSFVPKIIQAQTTLPESELTYYEDGLYVGIFEPGVPINTQGSVVNGNPYTGSAVEYIPNVVGYGTTAKKWAIIVDTNDYDLSAINDKFEPTEVIPASMYDGLWNTYGDNQTYYGIQSKTMETLRENSKLSGWYLPSKNELEFINSKLNHGFFIPEAFKSMNSGIYLTSTPYFERQSVTTYNLDSQIFKGQSFMFGQSYSKSDYGSIYLVPRTSQVNVRRIRRIELE
jgi:hypothetical protein